MPSPHAPNAKIAGSNRAVATEPNPPDGQVRNMYGVPRTSVDHVFVLCHDHELHQTLHVEKDNWMVQKAVLRQTEGFGFSVRVDRLTSAAVGSCDGRRTLRQIVESLASGFGLAFEQIAPTCTSASRDLLALGFLAPRGERPETTV